MKTFAFLLMAIAVVGLTTGFQMRGAGENRPIVQSAFGGSYYVRSVPSADFGTEGKTQVFAVKREGDELLDEYPVYMRGELYLGWSPLSGKWCLVHLEPERITSNNDGWKLGKVSRLAFYSGGKELLTYKAEDLEKMALKEHVPTLVHRRRGQFMVHGIRQIPQTNHYVFVIEKTTETGSDTETISLDITTGRIFRDDSEKKAEPIAPANGAAPRR